MRQLLLASALALGALAAAMPAHASIERINGFAGTVPVPPPGGGDQTLPPWGPPQPPDGSGPGYVIFNGSLSGPAGHYRLTYYGAEADLENEFVWDGTVIFKHTPPPTNTIVLNPTPMAFVHHGGGLLPFCFRIDGDPGNEVCNGGNNAPALGTPDFAMTVNPNLANQPMTSRVWHLFLDDGDPSDDDHDDMWVSIAHVPTPGAVLLFGAGLLGLGLARRRRG